MKALALVLIIFMIALSCSCSISDTQSQVKQTTPTATTQNATPRETNGITNTISESQTQTGTNQQTVTTARPGVGITTTKATTTKTVTVTTRKVTPITQGKNLRWSDEFNGAELDESNWGYEVGYVRNNEPQAYTFRDKRNVRVENGNLVLEARREADGSYTSGSVNTRGRAEFSYGIFEMRAKMPKGKAAWPAFWTMGIRYGWPACGEIDILEYYGTGPNIATSTLHFSGPANNHVATSGDYGRYDGPAANDFVNDYHLFGMIWTESKISFYLDNVIYGSQDITDVNRSELRQPQYILLNYALMRNVLEAEDAKPLETLPPNSQYKIDYVRIYDN